MLWWMHLLKGMNIMSNIEVFAKQDGLMDSQLASWLNMTDYINPSLLNWIEERIYNKT